METQFPSFSTSKTLVNIAAYFLLFLAGDLANSIIFDRLFSLVKFQNASFYVILRMLGCTFVTAFLFWLYTNKALHLKMSDFKITWNIQGWGILLSTLLPAFVVIVFLAIGKAETHMPAPSESVFIVIASMITALKAGVLEEMLFRGFIMTLLERRWNQYAAILAPSLLFGLAHIPSMEYFTIAGVLLLVISGTLVGVMFSLAAYKGNSISNGALMYAVWNFVMVTDILHITTAEGAYGNPICSVIIPSDNIWLTGGGFGVEASLIAVTGYALVCAFLTFKK
nr:type II CAAX endopeptidase family protein [uncultured Oscillibacter sp.]